jgi:hypothetical protein
MTHSGRTWQDFHADDVRHERLPKTESLRSMMERIRRVRRSLFASSWKPELIRELSDPIVQRSEQ